MNEEVDMKNFLTLLLLTACTVSMQTKASDLVEERVTMGEIEVRTVVDWGQLQLPKVKEYVLKLYMQKCNSRLVGEPTINFSVTAKDKIEVYVEAVSEHRTSEKMYCNGQIGSYEKVLFSTNDDNELRDRGLESTYGLQSKDFSIMFAK